MKSRKRADGRRAAHTEQLLGAESGEIPVRKTLGPRRQAYEEKREREGKWGQRWVEARTT